MASKRVEDYAYEHKISNGEAKRRMGGRRKEHNVEVIVRGAPVAGVGKKCKSVAKK